MSYENQILSLLDAPAPIINNQKPSEWAEQHRVMSTQESAFPGKFRYDTTPYLREPVDCLSPEHPAKVIAVMKGAQIGFSTGVIENGIGWIIANNPSNILLSARDESLIKTMVEKKIDPMIDSCGLRPHIRPNTIRAKNQRTGDTSMSKEFPGGSLICFSMQNTGRLRQVSAKFGFLDDYEAAKDDKNAGEARMLFNTRFKSFGPSKKQYFISTPEVKQTSKIEPIYLEGDQRKYHIPCPCCGDFIELKWRHKTENGKEAGITWKLDEDKKLIHDSVGYTCQSCGDFFDDKNKQELLQLGKWIPTATPKDPGTYSYHISTLYAPIGMDGWVDCVIEFLDACPPDAPVDVDKYKTFLNTTLGETWEAQGEKPKAKGISLNTRDYQRNVIPNQQSIEDGNGPIVLITMGSDMNGKEEDARLDYEIVAWSESGASYSIDHGSIGTFIPRENTRKIKVDRERMSYHHGASNSVWPVFQEIINRPLETDDGQIMKISITGLDTGYFTTYAYDFLDNCEGYVVGLKGKDSNKFRKMDADTPMFKTARERSDLYMVEVNLVKDRLAEQMKLRWFDGDGEQPPHFMNFPEPSEGRYTNANFFNHFESEHRIIDPKAKGSDSMRWVKVNTVVQNHMWDCRVYNITLKEITMHIVCKEYKVQPNWGNYVEKIIG